MAAKVIKFRGSKRDPSPSHEIARNLAILERALLDDSSKFRTLLEAKLRRNLGQEKDVAVAAEDG